MDFDALKDQWNEVEDRDGVRLSWNVFPSTRMVSERPALWLQTLIRLRKHRGSLSRLEHCTRP